MRKLLTIFLACALVVLMVPFTAFAEQPIQSQNVKLGTCSISLEDNGTLTIKPTTGTEGTLEYGLGTDTEYLDSSYAEKTKVVRFEGTIHMPPDVGGMFENFTQLETVETNGTLDFSNTQRMLGMFSSCSKLTNIASLSKWDVASAMIFTNMFNGCTSLTDITPLKDWKIGSETMLMGMFSGCPLQKIEIGSSWKNLKEAGIWTPSGETWTGKWVSANATTKGPLTSEELMSQVGSSSLVGAWTPEEKKKESTVPESGWVVNKNVLTISGEGVITRVKLPEYQVRQIDTLIIQDGIVSISDDVFGVFGDLANITSVKLPKTLTSIGKNAFSSCKKLQSVSIPDNVVSIGESAFQYCNELQTIELGAEVRTIEKYVFADCPKLSNFVFNNKLEKIGEYAFAQSGARNGNACFTQITIPSSVQVIEKRAFAGLENLEILTICGAAKVSDSAFANCAKLKKNNLPYVQSIENYAFQNCSQLNSVAFPNVQSVGDYAFRGCSSLNSLILPKALTHIGNGAFSDIADSSTIEFLGAVPSVGSSLSSEQKIIYPASNLSWTKAARISIANNPNNMYIRNSDKTLTKAPYISSYQSVNVPFGSAKSEIFSSEVLKGNRSFDFTVPKNMNVRISMNYTLPCQHGSFIVALKDSQGNGKYSNIFRTNSGSTYSDSAITTQALSAGEYHLEVIYLQSHEGRGWFTVGVYDSPSFASTQVMYRLYNKSSMEHLYTNDQNEIKVLTTMKNTNWKNEGRAWIAPTTSKTPVYRLYNYKSGEHHYTKDANEVKVLCNTRGLTWKNEGIKWYSDDAQGLPVYRVFNAAAGLGVHHFTSDANERKILTTQRGWKDEKIAWYGCK